MTDEWRGATDRSVQPTQIDTTVASVARVWNYLDGGRDNFKADRQAAQQLVAAAPVMTDVPIAIRAFLRRVITYLAEQADVRQFLDIGLGIPAADSAHEVARPIAPECRFVYVDSDPMVLLHAQALRSPRDGSAIYIGGDVREPTAIIDRAREALDFGQPIAIVVTGILNFIPDADEVTAILATLLAALAPGSHLAVAGPAADERMAAAQRQWNRGARTPVVLRDRAEVAAWFTGLDLVDPGIVDVDKWRPAAGDPVFPDGMPVYGAVARKP
jgi:S-adenosyl methyltransferase